LRGRLVLLVVASVVPLLAFILGYEYVEYRKDVTATGQQTLALARSMSQVVEQELRAYIAALQALTSSGALATGDFAEFRRRAEVVVARQFPGANILLLRKDGQQIMNTILPSQAPLPVRTNLENTRQVFATGLPAVSGLYQGQGAVGVHAVVAIDVPVDDQDRKVAYVLSLNPSLGVFTEILRRQSMPPSWIAGIVDRHGVVISRVPDGGFVGQKASSPLLGPLQTEREGIIESTSLEGVPLLTVFSHAGQSGWAVAIGVPKSDLTGPVFWTATQILAVGGVLLAVSLTLAGFAARRIAAPIRSLRSLAVATDNLALAEFMPTELREVDEIADAFRNARKRVEETHAALRKSEEQLRRAQRLAQLGSEVRDMRTNEVEWSDETYRIFGRSREAFIPTSDNILSLVHNGDREKSLTASNQVRLGICPSPCEYQIVRPDGSIRQIHREYVFTNDEGGVPLYLTGTVQDVTESRRIETQLRQSQKMEAVGTLTGGMAHDFNNLLGVIILNLGVAQRLLVGTDQVKSLVADALASARSGANLIRSLLAFARRQPLRPSRIEINDQVSNMNNLLTRVVGEDIEIIAELAPNLWPVIADPSQVEASIVNLATNARDAMPNGGRLTIATGNQHLDAAYATLHPAVVPGDYVKITVSDTGTGMTPEVLANVFEPFFTTKEQGKGTGLGLSMVFGFANQSGGHVSIYSEPGLGTTIRLFLPRAPDIAEPHAPMRSLSRTGLEKGRGETVLVVEDNAAMRKAVVNQLLLLNYRVLEADSGLTALVMLETEKAVLVLSDVVMPGGMDGFDLAARIRARWPSVRVLLTSGFSEGQWQAPANGSDLSLRLLSKPYDQEQLARTIWETLND
jgi:PAS domain S-box-containing protein